MSHKLCQELFVADFNLGKNVFVILTKTMFISSYRFCFWPLQDVFLQCKCYIWRDLWCERLRSSEQKPTLYRPKAFECNSFILPIAFLTVNIDRKYTLHIFKTMRLIAFRKILETRRKHISNELVVWHLWWESGDSLRQYVSFQFEIPSHRFCLHCSFTKGSISMLFVRTTIN